MPGVPDGAAGDAPPARRGACAPRPRDAPGGGTERARAAHPRGRRRSGGEDHGHRGAGSDPPQAVRRPGRAMAKSVAPVLARVSVASAKRRAWRGLILAQGGPAAFEQAMGGAGRLEHDAGDGQRREPTEQRRVAGAVVGEAAHGTAGMDGDVEVVLGDIDTGARCCGRAHLFRVLRLSSGPGRPGIRSGHKEKKGRSHSSSALDGQHFPDPIPSAVGGWPPPTAAPCRRKWWRSHKTSTLTLTVHGQGEGRALELDASRAGLSGGPSTVHLNPL